ncbi:MAG TPA: hypothetical protein VFW46_20210 [Stellaceae bacterium]|nr:hypothetical protein [Stellaceae bacterium]
MTTALDLITDALVSMGSYSPGETIGAADSATGLSVLNDMIDSWSNESLITYARKEQSVTLVPGKNVYTVGTGGDINDTRPLRILDGPGTCYVTDSVGNRYPVAVLNQDQWNLIGNVALSASNIPLGLFYDPQFPLGQIKLYPIPNIGWTLTFDSWLQLSEFPALTTALSLPPGYVRAIKRNLAIELWPYFKDDKSTPGAAMVRAAAQSLAAIKRTNTKEVVAFFDSSLSSRPSGAYNIYTDNQTFR